MTFDAPAPVVVTKSAVQTADGATIIRASNTVTVTVSFSSPASLSNVQAQFFVDDPEAYGEPRNTVAMTDLGNDQFAAVLPAQADRSVVRWRILADRGSGVETVSPRADDPAICPVGTGGAREAWYAYFVMPARASANPIYDCFISAAALNQLAVDISAAAPSRQVAIAKRVTAANGATTLDTITFGAQKTNVSQGRLPDGAAAIVSFANTPSPARSNYVANRRRHQRGDAQRRRALRGCRRTLQSRRQRREHQRLVAKQRPQLPAKVSITRRQHPPGRWLPDDLRRRAVGGRGPVSACGGRRQP